MVGGISNEPVLNIFWGGELETAINVISRMISADTPLNYPDFKNVFALNTDAYDKQVGGVFSFKRNY